MKTGRFFRNYMISEKRGKYKKVEQKTTPTCIFCSAVKNLSGKKLPSRVSSVPVIVAFSHCMLVVNKYPYSPKGHVMVVPYRHVFDIDDLQSKEIDEIFKHVIPKVKKALKNTYNTIKGFNIGMNIGSHAGASIEHLHIHIVPRFYSDIGFMEATSGTRILSEDADGTMKKIGKYFNRK